MSSQKTGRDFIILREQSTAVDLNLFIDLDLSIKTLKVIEWKCKKC